MASAKEKKDTQHVLVCARLRPFNSAELECGAKKCLEIHGRDITVQLTHGTKRYTFDRVFDMGSKQEDVYNTIIGPMIVEIMQGYNCTVFAYGQTGTGKTYTMVGNPTSPTGPCSTDPHIGIIPRTLDNLFTHLSKSADVDFTVRASYLELYNEVLIDLLSCEDKVLKIYEDQKSKGSVRVHGLEEVTVYNKREVFDILQKGSEKRMTASTLMNTQSSRSHTVFTITLHSRELTPEGEELVKTGKLNLVDLAGSENITKSGAIDKRAREAGSINQSLLTLGRVIKALVENSAHIPYRESKLTRILQDSLGGKTKTAIIATVSPASNNLEETMSTLDYAFRARNITNRPEINQRMSKKALIQKYLEEIDRLKKDVQAARTKHGVYLNPENYDMMVKESEKQKETLLKSLEECSLFESRVKELDRIRIELEEVYSVAKSELNDATSSLQKSKSYLKFLVRERRIQQELIDKYDESQTAFHQHSKALSEALDKYIKDQELFASKLDNLYSTMDRNERTSVKFGETYNSKHKMIEDLFVAMMEKVKTQSEDIQNNFTSNGETVGNVLSSYGAALDHFQCMIERVHNFMKETVDKIYLNCSNKIKDSNKDCTDFLENHFLSLQIITKTFTHEMSVIFDAVALYKKKILEEQNLHKTEVAKLVGKMEGVSEENIESLRVICNKVQQFMDASDSKSKKLYECSDDIYATYLDVDTEICDNLDELSANFTSKITTLKENIRGKHRTAMEAIVVQQKSNLVEHNANYFGFVSRLQEELEGIASMFPHVQHGLTNNVEQMSKRMTDESKTQEQRFAYLSTQLNNLKSLVHSYQQEENRIRKTNEEFGAKKVIVVKEMERERKEILKSPEESLMIDSDKCSSMERELKENRLFINEQLAENKIKNEELSSTMSQQCTEYVTELNDLSNTVANFVSTLTFPKRKGDTPKGKHSVLSETPQRVSKNIRLRFPDFQESDEEGCADIQDVTF